jgi:hypothetical protein
LLDLEKQYPKYIKIRRRDNMLKLNIQLFASKKGTGSSRNGRDSHSKRLGLKLSDGQFATAGSIIYRQRGTKIHPGRMLDVAAMIHYSQ